MQQQNQVTIKLFTDKHNHGRSTLVSILAGIVLTSEVRDVPTRGQLEGCHNTQHNDIRHKGIQHKGIQHKGINCDTQHIETKHNDTQHDNMANYAECCD